MVTARPEHPVPCAVGRGLGPELRRARRHGCILCARGSGLPLLSATRALGQFRHLASSSHLGGLGPLSFRPGWPLPTSHRHSLPIRAPAPLGPEALHAGGRTPSPAAWTPAPHRGLTLSLSTGWPGQALQGRLQDPGLDPGPRRSPGQTRLGTWVRLPAAAPGGRWGGREPKSAKCLMRPAQVMAVQPRRPCLCLWAEWSPGRPGPQREGASGPASGV